jgi:hypothetical protein
MTIYSNKKRSDIHRSVYINHYGPIPKDFEGRSYEIHHIDGDHSNNDPTNLKAVTIQEHYDIHYAQEEYNSCQLILLRMNISPEEIKRRASELSILKINNGTHHFITNNPSKLLVESGKHHFIGGQIQRDRIENKTHNFLDPEFQKKSKDRIIKSIQNKTHPFTENWICPHCKKTGQNKPNYNRYHGDNCKFKSQ